MAKKMAPESGERGGEGQSAFRRLFNRIFRYKQPQEEIELNDFIEQTKQLTVYIADLIHLKKRIVSAKQTKDVSAEELGDLEKAREMLEKIVAEMKDKLRVHPANIRRNQKHRINRIGLSEEYHERLKDSILGKPN